MKRRPTRPLPTSMVSASIGVFFLSEQLDQQDRDAVVKAGLGAPVAGGNVGVFAAHLAGLVEPEVFRCAEDRMVWDWRRVGGWAGGRQNALEVECVVGGGEHLLAAALYIRLEDLEGVLFE